MFEKIKDKQPLLYQYLYNSVIKDKVSHAYLFETDDFAEVSNFVRDFAKFLLCPNKGDDSCNICYLIDNNMYSDYYEIDTNTQYIKKEQILELQKEFKNKAMNNKRVYVIKDATKLNKSSANTLLKFLEEPENDIVAILLCRNRYQVLETIKSRCQIFSYMTSFSFCDTDYEKEIVSFLSDIRNENYAFFSSNYIERYTFFSDKNILIENGQKLLEFLYILVNYKTNISNCEVSSLLQLFLSNLEISDIIKLASVINDYLEVLCYNVNLKLASDKFVLELIEVFTCMN